MKNITKVMQQKNPENYTNQSNRVYSVKATDMMSAEELIDGIRSKIQSILMQSNGGGRKNGK